MHIPLSTINRRTAATSSVRMRGRAAAEFGADSVEAIALRVAEIIAGQRQPGELVDAGELARRFGISRTWVYANADLLGAIKLGNGSRPRLRFDPQAVARALSGVDDDRIEVLAVRRDVRVD